MEDSLNHVSDLFTKTEAIKMQRDLFDDLPKETELGDDGKVCNKCWRILPLSSFGPHSQLVII